MFGVTQLAVFSAIILQAIFPASAQNPNNPNYVPPVTRNLTLVNKCDFQVDPGFYPYLIVNKKKTGGFPLASKATTIIGAPSDWLGTIWGRTGCDAAGVCATGQCLGGESCSISNPSQIQNATVAKLYLFPKLKVYNDVYGVTTDYGYNMKLTLASSIYETALCDAAGSNQACNVDRETPSGSPFTITFC